MFSCESQLPFLQSQFQGKFLILQVNTHLTLLTTLVAKKRYLGVENVIFKNYMCFQIGLSFTIYH